MVSGSVEVDPDRVARSSHTTGAPRGRCRAPPRLSARSAAPLSHYPAAPLVVHAVTEMQSPQIDVQAAMMRVPMLVKVAVVVMAMMVMVPVVMVSVVVMAVVVMPMRHEQTVVMRMVTMPMVASAAGF